MVKSPHFHCEEGALCPTKQSFLPWQKIASPLRARNDKMGLFLHGTLQVGCALGDRREQHNVLAGCPDPARHLTFRSQVSCWFWRTGKLEKDGDLRSKPLAGPYRRLRPKDNGENEGKQQWENGYSSALTKMCVTAVEPVPAKAWIIPIRA